MIRKFSSEFRIIQNADRLAQRFFVFITIGFALFIIFASCILTTSPKYKLKPTVFLQITSLPSLENIFAYHDPGDLSMNVLLYVPLGLFLSLAVSFYKPRFLSPWILAGFLLSVVLEMIQYFIGRYADPVDLIANSFGALLGFWFGVFAIKYLGLRPSAVLGINPDDQTSTKVNTIISIRFLYVALYVVSSLLPFDLTFDFSKIYFKIHADAHTDARLILDPFYHFTRWHYDAQLIVGLFLGLLPVGILTAISGAFRKRLSLSSSIYTCLVLALLCELLQLFVMSRTTDIVMIFVSIAAGFVGWLLALVWLTLQNESDYSMFDNPRQRNRFLLWIMCGYLFILSMGALSPYRFEYSLKAIRQKIVHQTNWVPFRNHIFHRDVVENLGLVREIGMFVPLGLLSTFCFRVFVPRLPRLWTIVSVAGITLLSAVYLEFLKMMSVGYYGDITYIILAMTGGVMGSVFFRFLVKSR